MDKDAPAVALTPGADFHGLPTLRLANARLRVEFLAHAGPRIVRLCLAGSDRNLLAELPDVGWDTPYGRYSVRGGHRLWLAPESLPRSCLPDDDGLTVEPRDSGARLIAPTEGPSGIQKTVELTLLPDRPALALGHQICNNGLWPVELALWPITQLPLGGVAVLPESAGPTRSGRLPNRRLVFWPRTRWSDDRLECHDDLLLVHARASLPPFKAGHFNRRGWIGYLHGDVFFCKQFNTDPDLTYPDLGCSAEVYCDDRVIELETLGPLTRLNPGQVATHVEIWDLTAGLSAPHTLQGIRDLVSALGL